MIWLIISRLLRPRGIWALCALSHVPGQTLGVSNAQTELSAGDADTLRGKTFFTNIAVMDPLRLGCL